MRNIIDKVKKRLHAKEEFHSFLSGFEYNNTGDFYLASPTERMTKNHNHE
jgi:hypothetical protein